MQDASDILEKYWDRYLGYCYTEQSTPSYKDFLVWCDENVPEGDYEND